MKLYKIELRLYNYDNNLKIGKYMQELLITEDALERIKLIQSQEGEGFLRITVDGGGCSGFSYSFNFDNKKLEDDIIASSDKNGLPALVTDTISLNYLSGSKITWKDSVKIPIELSKIKMRY